MGRGAKARRDQKKRARVRIKSPTQASPAPPAQALTFRSQLHGGISDFLGDEGIKCAETSAAVVAVVAELSHYKEEGLQLSPEVYVCEDITRIATLLHKAEVVRLGSGRRSAAIALRALKECAPLADGGWAIFLERGATEFRYGVFRATNLPLALTPDEVLVGTGKSGVVAVVVEKIGDQCIELRGAMGNRRLVHFSAAREDTPSPTALLERFARAATARVRVRFRADTFRFLYRTLLTICQRPHGLLAVVVRNATLPQRLRDACMPEKPISLAASVEEYLSHRDEEGVGLLQGVAQLIAGMLRSDGIVVFRSDGSIVAYRAFLRSGVEPPGRGQQGGSRRRTFEGLKQMVGHGVLAALIRSQDGDLDYAGS